MFTNRIRHPLLFVHNHFSSYINKTTQKFKKDKMPSLLLTTIPPTPPSPPTIILIILSISLLLNYHLYNKNLLCHTE